MRLRWNVRKKGRDNMSRLALVKDDCQRVADAIAAALDTEVEIIDLEMMRVAGTGKVRNDVGSKLQRGFVNKHVQRTGEPVFIQEAGNHLICSQCPLTGACFYQASIVYPVTAGREMLGSISLIAFSERQKAILCARSDSYMEFVGRMADLIGAKVLEKEALSERLIMGGRLKAVMNSVDEGIIAIDSDGRVTHCNPAAGRLLGLLCDELVNQRLSGQISGLPLHRVLKSGDGFTDRECFVQAAGRRRHLLVTARPIAGTGGQTVGVVASVRDFKETQHLAYRIISAQKDISFNDIIGISPVMQELKKKAAKVAASHSTVLLLGESGTGKEVFARAIHSASWRRKKPFVAINCGALPETLLESELFGYEEGAFTGARKGGKPGKFELANQGTIFLDEIGNMSLYVQAKLLRVLQERQVERVGGNRPIPVDIRVIAATNSNLEEMIAGGQFRDDLYYRLSVIPLYIPPLRERPEDLPLLLDYYYKHFNKLLGKNLRGFTEKARQLCLEYQWPGNVRELINAVEYAVNLEEREYIDVPSLPPHVREQRTSPVAQGNGQWRTIEQIEKEAIISALEHFGWTEEGKVQAAHVLGISRATIYRKIAKYGLTPNH